MLREDLIRRALAWQAGFPDFHLQHQKPKVTAQPSCGWNFLLSFPVAISLTEATNTTASMSSPRRFLGLQSFHKAPPLKATSSKAPIGLCPIGAKSEASDLIYVLF